MRSVANIVSSSLGGRTGSITASRPISSSADSTTTTPTTAAATRKRIGHTQTDLPPAFCGVSASCGDTTGVKEYRTFLLQHTHLSLGMTVNSSGTRRPLEEGCIFLELFSSTSISGKEMKAGQLSVILTAEDDAWPSSTTTNAEIARNPHLQSGWRGDGPISLSLLLQDTRHRVRRRFGNSTPSRSPRTSSYLWNGAPRVCQRSSQGARREIR